MDLRGGGLSDTGSDTQFLPVGTPLYAGIPSNGLILLGSFDLDNMITTNPSYIQGDSINLLHSINDCPNGIIVTFSNTSYYYATYEGDNGNNDASRFNDSGYTGLNIGSIKIPKESGNLTSFNFTDGVGKTSSVHINANNNQITFEIYNEQDNYSSEGTHNSESDEFYAITSITAY